MDAARTAAMDEIDALLADFRTIQPPPTQVPPPVVQQTVPTPPTIVPQASIDDLDDLLRDLTPSRLTPTIPLPAPVQAGPTREELIAENSRLLERIRQLEAQVKQQRPRPATQTEADDLDALLAGLGPPSANRPPPPGTPIDDLLDGLGPPQPVVLPPATGISAIDDLLAGINDGAPLPPNPYPLHYDPIDQLLDDLSSSATFSVQFSDQTSIPISVKEFTVESHVLPSQGKALTEITIGVVNDHFPTNVEGSVRFPLPRDAVVVRYGFEINGKLVDAKSLTKRKAAEVTYKER